MKSLDQVKESVQKKHLKLKEMGYDVKLGHLYELQAHDLGYKNWAIASEALLSKQCDYKKVLPKMIHQDFIEGILPLAKLLESLGWHLAPQACAALDWNQAAALRLLDPELNPFTYPNGEKGGWWCLSNEDGDCHLAEMAGWVIDMVNSCSKSKGVWFPARDRHEFYDFYELAFFKGHTDSSLCELIEQESSYVRDHAWENFSG